MTREPTTHEAVTYDAANALVRETDIFDLPVHPLADSFGMMTEDELEELTDDIAAQGLLNPLVTSDGQLLDGRNRREACRRAQVIPDVVELDASKDPVAFVLSQNNSRRHRTQGAKAMAVALIEQVVTHGGRREKGRAEQVFSKNLLSQISKARLVIREAPELVEAVKQGGSLNQAYDAVLLRKRQREEYQQRLVDLRRRHPDVAAKVETGGWSMTKALEVIYHEELAKHQQDVLRQKQDTLSRLVESNEPPQSCDFDSVQSDQCSPADQQLLDDQQSVLGLLVAIGGQLNELKARPIVGGWWQETYSRDVQSAGHSIIAATKAIVKAHQKLAAREEVRRVAVQEQVRIRREARRSLPVVAGGSKSLSL